MKTSLVELREAQAARERLAANLQELQHRLTPQHLAEEVVEHVVGPDGSSVVKRMESAVRDYPLPMMLISAGSVLWMTAGSRSEARADEPSNSTAVPQGVKKNAASIGQSLFESAYQRIEARLSATLDKYAQSATSGIEDVSERISGSLRETVNKTLSKMSESMQQHPMTASMLVLALSAALAGKGSKNAPAP